jgi:hypothetical protein
MVVSQAIHVTAGNHCGPRSTRGLELYRTPPGVTEPLIAVEPLPSGCWNPCGDDDDNITTALKAHGKTVTATDIVRDEIDFCDRRAAPPRMQAIVANPPFSRAADFVRHGLLLVPKVVVLERIQFLESEARAGLFDAGKLARIFAFRNRVARMHLQGWNGKRASPSMMLAWFVFERAHAGAKPTIHWIRWEKQL